MPSKGYKQTPEHRAKGVAALRGHKVTLETRAKLSVANRGQKRSPEARAKMASAQKGNHNHWNGGRSISNGYVYIFCPDHPFANQRGYVAEHRLVMEAHVGRVLLPTEVVHHVNGTKDDNRIENLMLFSSTNEHTIHHAERKKK